MRETLGANPWLVLLLLGLAPILALAAGADDYILHLLTLTMIFAVFASGWNLTLGVLGLKTLGHHAFFAIGAYASALTSHYGGVSPWLTVWFGALSAAMAGLVIGFPILRIRSMPHVAIVTLAFAEIVRLVFANWQDVTRGEMGFWSIPPFEPLPIGAEGIGFGSGNALGSLGLALALFVGVHAGLIALLKGRAGLTFLAIRDSEAAAESLGVRLARWKLMAFALSAAIVGLSGAVYAHYVLILTPTAVAGPEMLITLLAMIIVGGVGRLWGPVLGALLLTAVSELLREVGDFRMILYGATIVAFVFVAPQGLAGLGATVRRRLASRALRRAPAGGSDPAGGGALIANGGPPS